MFFDISFQLLIVSNYYFIITFTEIITHYLFLNIIFESKSTPRPQLALIKPKLLTFLFQILY